jgi:hypothetical protein
VTVQRTAITTMTVEVTARSASAAKEMAVAEAEKSPFDAAGAAVRTRIMGARKAKTNH